MKSVNYKVRKLSDKMIGFCNKNGITIEDLEKISELELSKNEKIKDINPIIFDYGIIDISSNEEDEISIGDIAGWRAYPDEDSLFDILGKCYTDESNPYKYGTRSNSRLDLQKEELIKSTKESNSSDTIEVSEIEGKLFVSHNGVHRTSLMKLLYADEVLKGKTPIEETKEKYKIKAQMVRYDMTLTYIHYLLSMMKVITYMKVQYDERTMPTGKYIIETKDGISVVTRDEIINIFKEALNNNAEKVDLDSINRNLSIPSFKEFIKEYLLKENEYGNSWNNM